MNEEDETLKALREELSRMAHIQNTTSNPEIDNLSPFDLHQLIYNTFGEDSPIGFKKTIPEETLSKMPFLTLLLEYLLAIETAGQVKLTTRGNLPRKLCFELYNKGILKEDYIESGITKLSKEADSVILQNLKILSDLSGLTKKRNNKLSITKKGKKLMHANSKLELFKEIFITNIKGFNLGYHDGYPQEVGIQKTLGFTLYLLLRYGKEKRALEFYTKKQILAFPFDLDHFESRWSTAEQQYQHCLSIRAFERLLVFYGLVDYYDEKYEREVPAELIATPIFFEVFEIRNDKFKFRKTQYSA